MKTHRFRKVYPLTLLTVLLTVSPVVPSSADAQETRPRPPACATPSTYASGWGCDSANLPSRFNRFEDRARQVQRENPMTSASLVRGFFGPAPPRYEKNRA